LRAAAMLGILQIDILSSVSAVIEGGHVTVDFGCWL
jgi:hypothetical protein